MGKSCQHERLRPVVIFPNQNNDQAHRVALIRIQCNDCNKPFEFVGTEGLGALIGGDGRQTLIAVFMEAGESTGKKLIDPRRELELAIAEASRWVQ